MGNDSVKRVAVAGAGIMGLSAAYALRHHDVTVFDLAGPAPDNASARAGGMLAPYAEIDHLPEKFLGAALHGISIWKEVAAEHDIGFAANGSLVVAHEADEYVLQRLAAKIPEFEKCAAADIAALEPGLAGRFAHGIFLPREAHLDPQKTLAALAARAKFVHGAASPEKLAEEFDIVIDARGFAAAHDDKDLRGVKGEVAYIRNPEFSLARPVRLMHPRYPLYIVPRPDHVFMIGATVIESAGETPGVKSALELLSAAYSLHPSFGEAEIAGIRAGIRPAYPDNLPRVRFDGNIIRCNGLFRHGYLLAPVMAQGVADHIDGRRNNFISLFTREKNERHDQRPKEKNQRRA